MTGNQHLYIALGNALLILDDPNADTKTQHRAKIIHRELREFLEEIQNQKEEPSRHDAHLGSTRD